MSDAQNLTDVMLKSSNLEMALMEYFTTPTIEQYHALKILMTQLQADRLIASARIDRKRVYYENN